MFMDELNAAEKRINGFDKSESRVRGRYNDNRQTDDDLPLSFAQDSADLRRIEARPNRGIKTFPDERI
jgi:hypothetical protein